MLASNPSASSSSASSPSGPGTARLHVWLRALLAGPCAAVLTFLVFAAMPYWVPKGAGGVDHIAFPLFFMPAIWGVIFFYALLDRSLTRIAVVMGVITVIHVFVLKEYVLG
jgi:hypothetical protein